MNENMIIKEKAEQEIECENYVRQFLMDNGISPNKVSNMSLNFLLGISNGLLIYQRAYAKGVMPSELEKVSSIIVKFITFRNDRMRDMLNEEMK